MANIDGPKYLGPTVVDLTDVAADLVDLAPGDLQGARGEKEGIEGVLKELATAVPNHGEDAEIHPAVHQRILTRTARIKLLREKVSTLEKLLEVCNETLGRDENNREDDISSVATQVERMATKGNKPGLRAHFEKTIAYKAQIAEKGAETRRKNEEAKAAEAKAAEEAAKAKAAEEAAKAKAGGGQTPPV